MDIASNTKHREGETTKAIEHQTAKVPSDYFLWAALGSMATSLTFKLTGNDTTANFVGQWASAFLLLGIYNKLVKLEGSDQTSSENSNS